MGLLFAVPFHFVIVSADSYDPSVSRPLLETGVLTSHTHPCTNAQVG